MVENKRTIRVWFFFFNEEGLMLQCAKYKGKIIFGTWQLFDQKKAITKNELYANEREKKQNVAILL